MTITVTSQSIEFFRNLHSQHKKHPFVLESIENSAAEKSRSDLDINEFWSALVEIINITEVSPTGLNKQINDFNTADYKIKKWDCVKDIPKGDLRELAYTEFMDSGLGRHCSSNAKFAVFNRNFINEVSEKIVLDTINSCEVGNPSSEEKTCVFLQKFKGMGPKQSRKLLQYLGRSQYQIPIDSRILNQLEISGIDISGANVNTERKYQEVQNVVWEIAKELNVLPVVFDAIVFIDEAD